jgi:hypothetical protein
VVIFGIDDFEQLSCETVDRAQERKASQAEGNQHPVVEGKKDQFSLF